MCQLTSIWSLYIPLSFKIMLKQNLDFENERLYTIITLFQQRIYWYFLNHIGEVNEWIFNSRWLQKMALVDSIGYIKFVLLLAMLLKHCKFTFHLVTVSKGIDEHKWIGNRYYEGCQLKGPRILRAERDTCLTLYMEFVNLKTGTNFATSENQRKLYQYVVSIKLHSISSELAKMAKRLIIFSHTYIVKYNFMFQIYHPLIPNPRLLKHVRNPLHTIPRLKSNNAYVKILLLWDFSAIVLVFCWCLSPENYPL